jgi:hypothetical protein
MVCRGYAHNSGADNRVHIYAFARVVDGFQLGSSAPAKWRFWRPAVLQIVNKDLSVKDMRSLLDLKSMMQTMHALDAKRIEAVAQELGIHIDV